MSFPNDSAPRDRGKFTSESGREARLAERKTVSDRAAEMKARMLSEEQTKVRIPRRFADPESRRIRLKAIRARIDRTQVEMANAVGVVLSVYKDYECGIRLTPWPVLKLAEIELKRHIIKLKRRRQTARHNALSARPAGVPSDPAVCADILAMHVRGIAVGKIAAVTALRPKVVEYVIAAAESRGYNG